MPDHLFNIDDQVVVITGALGQLGRQFSRTLLERGARVAALDLPEALATAPEQLGEWHTHERLMLLSADVVQRDSLQKALQRIEAQWGAPTGLVNNAALDSPPNAPANENGPFEDYPEESWDKVMAVNTKGPFLCCQVFGQAMAQAGRGCIINIASIYGLVSPDQRLYEYRRQQGAAFYKPVAYSASKSALFNLTRYLATYWASCGVRVNTLTFAGVFNHQDEQFLQNYLARVPLGRMARPDEYNGAVVFLLSPAAAYITGANIVLDGGWTAW